jgi:hypothetical protein
LIEDAELTVKPPAPKEANMDSLSYYKNHPKQPVAYDVADLDTFSNGISDEKKR